VNAFVKTMPVILLATASAASAQTKDPVDDIARELGHEQDAQFFLSRSLDYRNLWKADTGFFHPKDREGQWILPFDYKYAGGQGARDYYDENNAWTYLWEVYHDVPGLIDLYGGRRAAAESE